MASPIEVMISSAIKDLLADRDAVVKVLGSIQYVKPIGAKPIKGPSHTRNPYFVTVEMAKNCDLYILLLGRRYGDEMVDGMSPTEIEFQAAYKSDPTKILVFKKGIKPDARQQEFIDRVSNYLSGYWITSYQYSRTLQDLVLESFLCWIKERASIGYRLNYFDHFVRFATQRIPIPSAQVYYAVDEDHVELKYKIFDRMYAVHFAKTQIYSDFWGSIVKLEEYFNKWKKDYYGRGH